MRVFITLFLLSAVFQVVSAVSCPDLTSTQTVLMTLTAANYSATASTSLMAIGSSFNGTSSLVPLTGSFNNPFLNSTVTSTTHITSTVIVAGSTSTETEDDTSMVTEQSVITTTSSVIPMTTGVSVSSDDLVSSDGALSITATTAVTATTAIPEITVTVVPEPGSTSIPVFTSVTLTSFLTTTSTIVVTANNTPIPVTSSLVFRNSTVTSLASSTGTNNTNVSVTNTLPLFTVTVVPLPVEINLTTTTVQVTVYATNITWSGTAYVVPSSTLNSTSTLSVTATVFTDTTININASALVATSAVVPLTTSPATVTANVTNAHNTSYVILSYQATHTVTYLGLAGRLHAPLPLLLLSNLYNTVTKAVKFCMPIETTHRVVTEWTTVHATIDASHAGSITSTSASPTHSIPVPIHVVESICPPTFWTWILSILGMTQNTHCHLPNLPINNDINPTSSYPNVSNGDFVQSALHPMHPPINPHNHKHNHNHNNARSLSAISTQYMNTTNGTINTTSPIAVFYISIFDKSTSVSTITTAVTTGPSMSIWTDTQTYSLNGTNITHTYTGTKTGAPAVIVSHTSEHDGGVFTTTVTAGGGEGVKEGTGMTGSVCAFVVIVAVLVLAL